MHSRLLIIQEWKYQQSSTFSQELRDVSLVRWGLLHPDLDQDWVTFRQVDVDRKVKLAACGGVCNLQYQINQQNVMTSLWLNLYSHFLYLLKTFVLV